MLGYVTDVTLCSEYCIVTYVLKIVQSMIGGYVTDLILCTEYCIVTCVTCEYCIVPSMIGGYVTGKVGKV